MSEINLYLPFTSKPPTIKAKSLLNINQMALMMQVPICMKRSPRDIQH